MAYDWLHADSEYSQNSETEDAQCVRIWMMPVEFICHQFWCYRRRGWDQESVRNDVYFVCYGLTFNRVKKINNSTYWREFISDDWCRFKYCICREYIKMDIQVGSRTRWHTQRLILFQLGGRDCCALHRVKRVDERIKRLWPTGQWRSLRMAKCVGVSCWIMEAKPGSQKEFFRWWDGTRCTVQRKREC